MTISTERGRGRRNGAVTIARIAEEAGVSVPTVSKVVNGRTDVAPKTRKRVEAIIRKHGYQRRTAPRTTSPKLLELVFHELESAWAIEIIRGVEQVARDNGLGVVLSELQGRRIPGRGWVEEVLARRPTGVISVLSGLSESQYAQLEARGIPVVVVDPVGDAGPEVAAIGATNWRGGLDATRHLIELGHRRIAVVSGPQQVLCSRARLDGFRAAMETAALPVDPALIRHGDFHVEGGYRHGRALLGLADPPSAIFTGNDLQALGVYEAAREAGRRIPDQLSVVGFDDLPIARWVGPPLTTVRQPLVEMAMAGTQLMLALAARQEPVNRRVELATSLVVRQSTAPPPRG